MGSSTSDTSTGHAAPDWPHPFDPAVLASPFEFDRALRARAPVHRDPHTGLFLVAAYERVVEVLRQPAVFSSRFGQAMASRVPPSDVVEVMKEGYPPVDTMLTADPPEHTRFRGLVNKAFTPRRVRVLEEAIRAIASELVDGFASRGAVDLVDAFAIPLPLTVIADQLGVPRSDLARFHEWTEGFTAQLGGFARGEDQVKAARRIVEYQRYFADRLEEARQSPRDDILSDLVRARLEGERPLDVAESLSIIQQLLVAGHETTAASIAEGLWLLIRHPDQLARVLEDPDLVPNLVEEVLRLTSPTQNMWRVAARDVELGGVEIAKGSFLLLRYGSANRDESVFPDPDRFDVGRENASEHLAFGHGIHFCVGASLARKELEIGFRTLLDRLGDWRVADGFEPEYPPSFLLRGMRSLPLEFSERSAP